MNTARSTVIGWGVLVLGAGVSYYFAKRSINDRRMDQARAGTRPPEIKDWKQRIQTEQPGQPTMTSRPNLDGTHIYPEAPSPKEGYRDAAPK
ncbi:hypothetical protein BU17DRAFT_101646 [Hysterangium stoloniferum]|nr:hypothetical protein BU17DRAFT_101646 [Hysterangium stoloniferum]